MVGIESPIALAGHHARAELILLDVRLLLHQARAISVYGESWRTSGHERASLERRDHLAITQHELKEVVGPGAAALERERPLHTLRNSEQHERLVDEVRTEVVEKSGSGPGNLA